MKTSTWSRNNEEESHESIFYTLTTISEEKPIKLSSSNFVINQVKEREIERKRERECV